ncbi:MAG: aspartate aminotransferase family protein [Fusobacterium sp. JB019]|nr:aspartate aminotransferase family protein [Fusobacterium sp. JB019]
MNTNNVLNTYNRFDAIFTKGKGVYLYDINNEKYFDFVSGIAVNCLGHSNPEIVKTIKNQSETLMHISNLYWNDKQLNLADKLNKLGDLDKVFFCNSGTEANELALKIARKFGKNFSKDKNKILYMKNSFHGRTLGALSVTGQEKYQTPYKPILGGTVQCEFNNIKDFYAKFDRTVCGVIIELIQGEGGIIEIDPEFLQTVKNLCDINNALLITDDVQCGIGRLGTFFAYQKFSVTPDIITVAKGLGGGFPIGAVLVGKKAADTLKPGDHGSTFGGNPLACSVANTVVDQLTSNNILAEVNKKGSYFKGKINLLIEKYELFENINGMGLLLGLKLKDKIKVGDFVKKAFEKHFLLVGAGNNTVRLLPPLNVTYKELDKAAELLEETIKEF